MAKKGRPRLWENCSIEEQTEVAEIEKSYEALKVDYVKGNISLKQYHNRRKKLVKKLYEVEKKYEV